MITYPKNKFKWLLVLSVIAQLAWTGCTRENVEVESGNDDARMGELAARFNVDLTEAEFTELYNWVKEKTDVAYASEQTPLADVSNRDYELTYSNQVRIEVGGAVYLEDLDQVEGGTTVNGIYLPPELFDQLNAAAPHDIHLRIRDPFDITHFLFPIRQIIMTVNDPGQYGIYYGLYNIQTHEYVFLGAGGSSGTIGNVDCGAISLGRVAGILPPPYTQISNGEIGYGFIAGCNPVIVGASITFYYTGTAAQ